MKKSPLSLILACLLLFGIADLWFYQNIETVNTNFNTLKAQLSALPTSTIRTVKSSASDQGFSSIVLQWRPLVAHVVCSFSQGNAESGSGLLTTLRGQISFLTSKHIIISAGQPAVNCLMTLPGNGTTYVSNQYYHAATNDIDAAVLAVANPDDYVKNLVNQTSKYVICGKSLVSVGDWIVVLGYPVNGVQNDIVATEGIISGYDGTYYVTSAKLSPGNSGGVAILRSQDCDIGIPSYVETSTVESLGRILDENVLSNVH